MPIDDEKLLYDELGKAWLHFASWRERIFAGYLSVLAVLAYAFSRDASNPIRAAILGFAILVSIVFRILDIRTTRHVNLCQRVGRSLAAGKGLYAEIDKDRFSTWRVTTYGFGINVLVAGVIGPSVVASLIYILKWRDAKYVVCWRWSVIAVVGAIVVLIIAECCTGMIWKGERDEYEQPKTK